MAEVTLVGRRCDRRNLGDHAVREDFLVTRILVVRGVVVERRQRTDDAGQHRHRMRVVAEAIEETIQRLVDHRVLADRSEENTSELQSLMSTSYAVFCLKKKKT